MKAMLEGKYVRLTALEPKEYAAAAMLWQEDSEYTRMSDTIPVQFWSPKRLEQWSESALGGETGTTLYFAIRTLEGDRLIGSLELSNIESMHREVWLGIGIGEREYWNRGYGTDAMRLALRFAFEELAVRRVTLSTHAYNYRGIRCYEKVGFRIEGCTRDHIHRENRRWDMIYMGILRDEWQATLQR